MFFRVTANICFTEPDEARDFYHDCEVALPKGAVINPGQINEEKSRILLHQCFHDLDPSLECQIIDQDSN